MERLTDNELLELISDCEGGLEQYPGDCGFELTLIALRELKEFRDKSPTK